jgi:diaminopimelate decarboxylase
MDHFNLIDGELHAEDVPLRASPPKSARRSMSIRARRSNAMRACSASAGGRRTIRLAFAVKANPNLAVLRLLANAGFGADVVSGGELAARARGGHPAKDVVFSGVGKTAPNWQQALERGIGQFNLELEEEGERCRLAAARMGMTRQRPSPSASTRCRCRHAQQDFDRQAPRTSSACRSTARRRSYARARALPGLRMRGVAVHIGSQLTDLAPMERAFERVGSSSRPARRRPHRPHVDLGGGLGVPYNPAGDAAEPRRITARWSRG